MCEGESFICAVKTWHREKEQQKRKHERGGREEGGTGRRTKDVLGYASECQPDSFCYYTLLAEAAKTPPTHTHTLTQIGSHTHEAQTVSYFEHVCVSVRRGEFERARSSLGEKGEG